MIKGKPEASIRIRIVVVAPPPDVRFAVQRGNSELLAPSSERAGAIQFDLSLRLKSAPQDGSVNFLGEYAQGTPSDRFIYVNSGTLAGQEGSPWTRRAKLKLGGIPKDFVTAAASNAGKFIEARVVGTMGDGGPVCASVKPDSVEWKLVRG